MKKWFLWMLTAVFLVSIMLSGCSSSQTSPPQVSQPVELNISAAVSLKDALTEIQKNYQSKAPNVKLVYNLGASGTLAQQIEQGAPADIFISAAPKQMNDLDAKNLINKSTRRNLVENKLVLVVPQNSNLGIDKFEDMAKTSVQKFSIGEPSVVPAGQYAQQVMQKLMLWDQVKDKAVLAKDVRTVLAYVETGNVEAGIVYKTDAVSSPKVKIAATAPEGSHEAIVYPIAILSNTKQSQVASDFITYLTGPEGKAVLEKYGFVMGK